MQADHIDPDERWHQQFSGQVCFRQIYFHRYSLSGVSNESLGVYKFSSILAISELYLLPPYQEISAQLETHSCAFLMDLLVVSVHMQLKVHKLLKGQSNAVLGLLIYHFFLCESLPLKFQPLCQGQTLSSLTSSQ